MAAMMILDDDCHERIFNRGRPRSVSQSIILCFAGHRNLKWSFACSEIFENPPGDSDNRREWAKVNVKAQAGA